MTQPHDIQWFYNLWMNRGPYEWVGTTWYVDSINGDDTNVGNIPTAPFKTLVHCLGVVNTTDRILVARGTYDGAHVLATNGVKIIIQNGTWIRNSTPGTAFVINGTYAHIIGGNFYEVGQIGVQITASSTLLEGVRTGYGTIGFDINSINNHLKDCISVENTVTGFDISSYNNILDGCYVHGAPASRGFYLSNAAADHCLLYKCKTLNCTAAGYEIVAGADENLISHCSQSELCAGPVDAGANNTWIWEEESQIAIANSLQQDLADIHTQNSMLRVVMDFWSVPQEEVAVTNVAGDKALPDVVVSGLPGTVVRAVAMFKFRMVENTNVAANKLNGAQEIQVDDSVATGWLDAINFVDDMFSIAAGPLREGGDVLIGAIDVSARVDGDDTYNFQWDEAVADLNGINFNDVQVGLRIWCSPS